MRSICLMLAAPLLAGVAQADENWQLLVAIDYHGGGAFDLLVDESSIKRQQGFLTVRMKIAEANPKKRPDLPPTHETIETIVVDCEHARWAPSKPVSGQYDWHWHTGRDEMEVVTWVCNRERG